MLVHTCIVRRDLPYGVQAAMLVHAAGESGPAHPGTYAVVLAAADEIHLDRIRRRLVFEGIEHVAIREPDPPYDGALMAIGLPPVERDQSPSFLRRLSLL